MTSQPTTSRALTGLPPRRSLGPDSGLAALRRDRRAEPPVSVAVDSSPVATDVIANRVRDNAEPSANSQARAGAESALPRYLQLTRKEARIREDQADRLTEQVRRLNQARKHRGGSVGERITDNTLIRVALDLLLERSEALVGVTEQELRDSVTR